MNPKLEQIQQATRRHFIKHTFAGLGGMALGSLMNPKAMAKPADPLAAKEPHFPAKAKRVIYLHLTGSPPNLDLYDYKPELVKRDGQDCPAEFLKGKKFLTIIEHFSPLTLCCTPQTWTHHRRRDGPILTFMDTSLQLVEVSFSF